VNKLRDTIAEDCPQILTFHKAFYTTVQPWARRTSSNMLLEGAFKYSQVDMPLRARLQRQWNRAPLWPIVVVVLVILGAVGYALSVNRQRNA
jgi:hypothetical protein